MYGCETCYTIDPSYNLTLVFRSFDLLIKFHLIIICASLINRSCVRLAPPVPCALAPCHPREAIYVILITRAVK